MKTTNSWLKVSRGGSRIYT